MWLWFWLSWWLWITINRVNHNQNGWRRLRSVRWFFTTLAELAHALHWLSHWSLTITRTRQSVLTVTLSRDLQLHSVVTHSHRDSHSKSMPAVPLSVSYELFGLIANASAQWTVYLSLSLCVSPARRHTNCELEAVLTVWLLKLTLTQLLTIYLLLCIISISYDIFILWFN